MSAAALGLDIHHRCCVCTIFLALLFPRGRVWCNGHISQRTICQSCSSNWGGPSCVYCEDTRGNKGSQNVPEIQVQGPCVLAQQRLPLNPRQLLGHKQLGLAGLHPNVPPSVCSPGLPFFVHAHLPTDSILCHRCLYLSPDTMGFWSLFITLACPAPFNVSFCRYLIFYFPVYFQERNLVLCWGRALWRRLQPGSPEQLTALICLCTCGPIVCLHLGRESDGSF